MPPQNSAKLIAATAAVTLAISGVAALIFQMVKKWKQKDHIGSSFRRQETTVTHEEYHKFRRRVNGLVVGKAGKEVLNTRKQEAATFPNIVLNPSFEEDEEKSMDISVQRSINPRLLLKGPYGLSGSETKAEPVRQNSTQPPPVSARLLTQPPSPPPPPIPAKKVPAAAAAAALPPAPPPPPSPLCHPLQATLPPIRVKRNTMPASPPSQAINLASSLKPPPAQKGNADKNGEGAPEDRSNGTVVGKVKLKPLHWDKVATNFDQSMVWNEIKDGSLR